MRYFGQLLAKLETLRAKYRTPQQPAPSVRGRFRPRGEQLEDRTVPRTTVFLDFGEGFSNDILSMRVSELAGDFDEGGIQGPDLSEDTPSLGDRQRLQFQSLESFFLGTLDNNGDGIIDATDSQNWDYNNSGTVDVVDYLDFRGDVLALVTRIFSPFDVDVRVASAANLQDVRNTLGGNFGDPTGRFDAYVFVTPIFTPMGGTMVSAGNFLQLDGIASDRDLNDPAVDPTLDRNDTDETVVVFAENAWSGNSSQTVTNLANVAAHEAGHTFGLAHTRSDGLTESDIMQAGDGSASSANWELNRAFFSRFPHKRDEVILDPNLFPIDSWFWLKEDDDIGLRENSPEFVTGTGVGDVIRIGLENGVPLVRIGHYTPSGFDTDHAYPISLGSGVWVEGGRGDDKFEIDSRLATHITVVGGAGNDWLWVDGHDAGSLTYRPNAGTQRTLDGMDVMSGEVTIGNLTVTFDEFEPQGRVTAVNVAQATLESPALADRATLRASALSDDLQRYVPFDWINATQVILDLGAQDTTPQTDRVTISERWPNVQIPQDLTARVTIRTGNGDDRLTFSTDDVEHLSGSGGQVRWEAGAGLDILSVSKYSRYLLETSKLTFSGAGTSFIPISLELEGVEQAQLLGALDSDDTFIVSSWDGQAYLSGVGGEDRLIVERFVNAEVRTGTNWFFTSPPTIDEIDLGSAVLQVFAIEEVQLQDLATRSNSVTVNNDADLNDAAETHRVKNLIVNTTFGSDIVHVIGTGMSLTLNMGDDVDEISIDAARADVAVHAGAAADNLTVGGGDYFANIKGAITVEGSDGSDTLLINDASDTSGQRGFGRGSVFNYDTYTLQAGLFDKSERTLTFFGESTLHAPTLTFSSISSVTLSASGVTPDGDTPEVTTLITVASVASDTTLTVNANGGSDWFLVGDGNYLANILGAVTLNGGEGDDFLTIDDDEVVAGFGALGQLIEDQYSLELRTFSKKATVTFFGGPEPLETPVLTFDSISEVTLNASTSLGPPLPEMPPSVITINSLASGTTLTINANAGDDIINYYASAENATVTLNGGSGKDAINVNRSGTGASIVANGNDGDDTFGVGNGNYETKIRGPVTVDGGVGEDHLQIDDSTNDLTGLLNDHRFATSPDDSSLGQYINFLNQKPFPESETLSFREVQSVELLANAFSNDIRVRATIAGATYTLNGNGGADEFIIDAAGLNSTVEVHGGPPNEQPGDSLLVTGVMTVDGVPISSGEYRPDPANSRNGRATIDGHLVRFTGLEPVVFDNFATVRFVSPLSFDNVNLEAINGGLRISGTSTNPIPVPNPSLPPAPPLPGTAWEVLEVKNTSQVVLDLSENDLNPFVFGPWIYLPLPNDVVTVHPDALAVPGLESVVIGTGPGANLVHDHTLESAGPATAELAIVGGGPGTVAGVTSHLVYGSREGLEIEYTHPILNTWTASAADGTPFAKSTDFAIAGGVIFVDPQRDVQLDLGGVPEVTLREGSNGRQRIVGPVPFNPIEIAAHGEGRLRLLASGTTNVHFEAVVFPEFEFGPLMGTGIDPTGTIQTFAVTNTLDSGPGSLRAAIDATNAFAGNGLVIIPFAIPETDPAFVDIDAHLPGGDAEPDAFVFAPLTELPALTRGNMIINGPSQQALTGDTNPFGPEVILSGHLAAAGESINGLVSLYRLDGSVEDVAGENEPSATAGVSFIDGRIGQGATITSGGFIDIPHSDNLANQVFTLSAWVRPDGPGPNDDFFGSAIVAKGLSPALGGNQVVSAQLTYSAQLNRFLFGFGNFFSDATRIISAETFAPGQFYHVAGTYDGVTFRLYVNGRLQGEKALVKTIDYDPTIPWTIGSAAPPFRAVGFPRTLNGVIDEVGIYNRALSAEEIKSLAKVSAGGPIDGLRLASFGNLVHGLNIQGFSGNGVLVEGDNNRLTGNSIGTSATGDASVANGGDGIHIVDGRGNLIGGLTDADRNVVSGNAGSGVAIQGGFKNIIRGNFIGTTADGLAALGNHGAGIAIRDSSVNLIGGDTAEARNVIAANGTGVSIVGTLAGENRVSANYIGVAADGATDLGNFDGVFVGGGAAGNVIGGSLPGERNVIAGNFRSNIFLSTMGTRVQGNYIGTDSTGARQVESDSRSVTGIRLEDDKNSLIGGLLPEEGNLISGHEVGIQFNGQWVAGGLENVRVQGNRIGTTADGEQILANRWGFYLTGHVDSDGVTHLVRNVLIGGTEVGAGNLISGNTNAGIIAFGPGVQGLRIEGNRIGTDVDGDEVLRNGNGILLHDAFGVTIGGAVPQAGNLIAGNSGNGITISGGSGHVIQANSIGTNADGNFKLGNFGDGVFIENSSGNTIGGSLKGSGNVVAFNGDDGIALAGVSGGTIEGNTIGTDRLGRFLGNVGDGISLQGSTGVRIAGNAVGANTGTGLLLLDSSSNSVLDNAIGSTRLVKPLLPNAVGLSIQGGSGNTVDGNVVSGNTLTGIHLGASSGNTLINNRVGVADDGSTPIGNSTGVVLAEASFNTFESNTISGNLGSGVQLAVGSEGNRFFGNRIGTSADGALAAGNGGHGLLIGKGARGNFVGVERDELGNDDPGQGNVIAFNALAGVAVVGDAAVGNWIRGNSIHSNGGLGIDLGGDLVTANDYGDPKAKPPIPPDIDLGPNNLQNAPDIQQVTATAKGIKVLGQLHSVPGTPFIIDFYANSTADPSGHGEGRRWLGSKTITTGNEGVGAITFDILPEDATVGEFITATATHTVTGDTSEFSSAVLIIDRGGRNLEANESPATSTSVAPLTTAQVEPLLSEAIARWNDEAPSFDVRIADLPGLTLGMAAGNTIWLDADAAGWGWFVDPTPWDDSEFTTPGDQGEKHKIDLLSVLIHELGHMLGHDHGEGGVMDESLAADERLTLGGVFVDGRDWFLAPAEGDDGFPHPNPRRHGR